MFGVPPSGGKTNPTRVNAVLRTADPNRATATAPRSSLFEREVELAFELAAEGAGLLGHDHGITAGHSILFSPREHAATGSAPVYVGRDDLFSVRAQDRHVGSDIRHLAGGHLLL